MSIVKSRIIGAVMLVPAIIFGVLMPYISAFISADPDDVMYIIMNLYLFICVFFLTAPFEAGKNKASFIVKIAVIVIAKLVISVLVWNIYTCFFVPIIIL